MKTTSSSTNKIRTMFEENKKQVEIFDYNSKGMFSNISRIALNVSGMKKTSARKQLVEYIKSFQNKNIHIHIYAHSHGALILYRALTDMKKDNVVKVIKNIYTFGAASPIPYNTKNHILKNINIINYYNDKDWMIGFIKHFGYEELFKNQTSMIQNIKIKGENFKIQILNPIPINMTDPHSKSNEILQYQCSLKSKNAHKIPCYFTKMVELIITENPDS